MRESNSSLFLFLLSLYNYSFGPTRTPSPWDGVRKADKFSAVCPQRLPEIQNEEEALKKMPKGRLEYLKRLLPFLQNQSEDCLYLNVFSPLHGKIVLTSLFLFTSFSSNAPQHKNRITEFISWAYSPFSLPNCSGHSREETSCACVHSWRVIRMELGKSLWRFHSGELRRHDCSYAELPLRHFRYVKYSAPRGVHAHTYVKYLHHSHVSLLFSLSLYQDF